MKECIITGIAASAGIQIGTAYHYALQQAERKSEEEHAAIDESQIDEHLAKLRAAKNRVLEQLDGILERNQHRFGEEQKAIITGHKGLLQDPAFTGDMEKLIRKQLLTAASAAMMVTEKFVTLFQSMDKEYMRERAQDIQDIGGRLLDVLQGKERQTLQDIEKGSILIAHDITPSDAMDIDHEKVVGFVTKIGGKTSHTAILARSVGIPAIVGMGAAIEQIPHGAAIIIDGGTGECILHPSEETIEAYKVKSERLREEKSNLEVFRHLAAQTKDGASFELVANIGSVQESQHALASGAEGVGLFRTEFMYMNARQMPSEEEQFAIYKEIAGMWEQKPIVIRTLDIGGDKELPYLSLEQEVNPFLGYRAIRIGLNQPDVLRTQLRALLRASAYGTLRIMFPMISSLEEWRQARAFVTEISQELAQEGIPFDASIQVGIMAEIPSVIQMADLFAKEVDFFSIGTNDLVQYTLAVDRMNEKVAYLYDHFHPAVLRSIQNLIRAAHAEGKWVGMCGGMAGDPMAAPILIGCGLDEWSMEPSALNSVKAVISKLNKADCVELMTQLQYATTAQEVRTRLESFIQQ
jgi:phosphotransferase system enzyme I (PtsI)